MCGRTMSYFFPFSHWWQVHVDHSFNHTAFLWQVHGCVLFFIIAAVLACKGCTDTLQLSCPPKTQEAPKWRPTLQGAPIQPWGTSAWLSYTSQLHQPGTMWKTMARTLRSTTQIMDLIFNIQDDPFLYSLHVTRVPNGSGLWRPRSQTTNIAPNHGLCHGATVGAPERLGTQLVKGQPHTHYKSKTSKRKKSSASPRGMTMFIPVAIEWHAHNPNKSKRWICS